MPSRKPKKCEICGLVMEGRHTNARAHVDCRYQKALRDMKRKARADGIKPRAKRYKHDYQRYHAYLEAWLREG